MHTNPALELAFDYVAYTSRNLFLTGKAGTGKTTFLHRVKNEVPKQMAVVAPTGVAAINAGAQTIHSLFTLPFGFLEPGKPVHYGNRRLSSKKKEVLRTIDLLIIDEISMVRADLLDAIDTVLRSVRRNGKPFGGVQVLMIGDLHQLPPVVTRDEEHTVRRHYQTSYYFGAKVMARANAASIPLTHIYRQSDGDFIDLLNKVRHNEIDETVINQLNTRFRSAESLPTEPGYITLTSHNRAAGDINARKLGAAAGAEFGFEAVIHKDFPKSLYPNDPQQRFKIGAQVMFNRNDPDGMYYNGKIGTITDIVEGTITVQCQGDETSIAVNPVTWENNKTTIDNETGAITQAVVGTYTQHPLRLAWAITIHKSQGLTLIRSSSTQPTVSATARST